MFILIENGEIYTPEPIGVRSVLLANEKILRVGTIDRKAVEALGVEVEVIDAKGCIVAPGLIDPHQHLLGGSGESGFASQTPEISASEIAAAGITTVVGCLGADTAMKTLAGLLAKVKGLREEGLNAYMWSGGYNFPPTSIAASVRDDVMFIEEVVGAGEIAIADARSSQPTAQELARLAHDVYVGGQLSRKAGIVHVHVGEGQERLELLREVIDHHAVEPEWIYATHISRSDELMLEAIELAERGSHVDIDTADGRLADFIRFYLDHGGREERLTVSSDASITSPLDLYKQIRACIVEEHLPIETVLRFVTSNTADVLKLALKGRLKEGLAADVLIATKDELEIREVISLGRRLVKDGSVNFKEKFLEESDRTIELKGAKAREDDIGPAAIDHEPASSSGADGKYKAESLLSQEK